jgi:hypothetical protein
MMGEPDSGMPTVDAAMEEDFPECAGEKAIWKIAAYLDTRLVEQQVSDLIDELNGGFEELGVPIQAVVERIVPVEPEATVPWDLDGVHVGVHFSPDHNGGYIGPPTDQIFAPMLPAGSGEFEANVVTHEGMHFFGVQDLYTLTPDMLGSAKPPMNTDVMVFPRQEPITLHPTARRIACTNAALLRDEGRESIFYPVLQDGHPDWVVARMADEATINIKVFEGAECQVFRSNYNFDNFEAGYEEVPVEVNATPGLLSFTQTFHNWYLSYKVTCNVGQFYIPSLLIDDCFLGGGGATRDECTIDCSLAFPGQWCE